MVPVALLSRVLRGFEPGFDGVGVLLRPASRALQRVAEIVDPILEVVDLLLVECQRIQERVGYGIFLRQVLDYERRESRLVVDLLETHRANCRGR